jgi:low affinity Fe/Cu permease
MGKVIKRLAITVLAIVAAFAVLCIFSSTQLGNANPITGITTAIQNQALDNLGIKSKIDSTLRNNEEAIANYTGMSESQVDDMIDNLDIQDWNATQLPSNATVANTYNGNYGGTEATITTYDDPSYVTVCANDQNITLSVPESAQSYLSYLQYL